MMITSRTEKWVSHVAHMEKMRNADSCAVMLKAVGSLEDLDIDVRIILKYFLKKLEYMILIGFL
jgi:hypothetical protein